MLNVLYEEFGIEISEEQLRENADEIAAKTLSSEQVEFYGYCKAEQKDIVDHYVKAVRLVEFSHGNTVNAAGHEVQRDPQTNLMTGLGTPDCIDKQYGQLCRSVVHRALRPPSVPDPGFD